MKTPKVISYSALSNWQYCPHFYKLKNIDRLDPFVGNIWTYHGKLVHKYLQVVLKGEMSPTAGSKAFTKTWKRFCRFYKESLQNQVKKHENPVDFAISGEKAVAQIKKKFEKEFGKYKVVGTEVRLDFPSAEKYPQNFKGFIDIVLELEDGKIVIIDFKGCHSSFMFNKYRDKYKDYQLTLYKHYYCLRFNVSPRNVETYFVPIERNPKSKLPVSFFRVTSGPKKVANALAWLQRALGAINRGDWTKNRMACLKYSSSPYKKTGKHACVFYESEHCTSQKISS
jgi:hypothetical protein